MNISQRESKLKEILSSCKSLAIAFSGGTDSTILAAIASEIPDLKLMLFHIRSPLSITKESKFAVSWAKQNGIKIKVLKLDPLMDKEIRANSKMRCYHCKKFIMQTIIKEASEYGISNVADGTNTDDYGDYRPGLKACEELAVIHPLADAGFNKNMIRLSARRRRIPNWRTPASACLASRIPYGIELTSAELKKIQKAEDILRDNAFPGSRVRNINGIAKIELNPLYFRRFMSMRIPLLRAIRKTGFKTICLDLGGYSRGSLN